jgi:hypothetical protein
MMRDSIGDASPIRPSGYPFPVPAFVVGADNGAYLEHEPADAGQHVLAFCAVGFHDGPFLIGELAGLVDDFLGNGNLSDVVQQGSELDVAFAVGGEAEPFGDRDGELDDIVAVRARVLIVGYLTSPSSTAVPRYVVLSSMRCSRRWVRSCAK